MLKSILNLNAYREERTVTLGKNTETNQPITITQEDLHRGTYVLAAPGMGKSTLLASLAIQQLQRDESVIVIDPKGDTINSIISRMPASKLRNTHYLTIKESKKLFDKHPFAMNVFSYPDPGSISIETRQSVRNLMVMSFFKLWPELVGQVYFPKMLRFIVPILLDHPTFTISHIPDFLEDKAFRHSILQDFPTARRIQTFWRRFDNWTGQDQRAEISSFSNRIEQLLDDLFIPYHIGAKHGKLDIRKAILNKENLFIHLPVEEGPYTGPLGAARVIGTFLLLQIYAATFSFASIPEHERPKFTLIVDEFAQFSFAAKEFRDLFAYGRGYGIKQVLCHQYRSQISAPELKEIASATTGAQTIVCLRLNMDDAAEMAKVFTKLSKKQTELKVQVLGELERHKMAVVREFFSYRVLPLLRAAKLHETMGYENVLGKSYRYEKLPSYDLGIGIVEFEPHDLQATLTALNDLLYCAQRDGYTGKTKLRNFIDMYGKLTKQVRTVKIVELRKYQSSDKTAASLLKDFDERKAGYIAQMNAIKRQNESQCAAIDKAASSDYEHLEEFKKVLREQIAFDIAQGKKITQENSHAFIPARISTITGLQRGIESVRQETKHILSIYEYSMNHASTEFYITCMSALRDRHASKTTDSKGNILIKKEDLRFNGIYQWHIIKQKDVKKPEYRILHQNRQQDEMDVRKYRNYSGPPCDREGRPSKDSSQSSEHRAPLFAHGGEIAADDAKGSGPFCTAKGPGNLLLHFDHAQISLRLVVGKRHGKIFQEAKHLICPL